MSRAQILLDDICHTRGFGSWVSDPPHHFTRIFKLFSIEARQSILTSAYRLFRTKIDPAKGQSLEQFVAYGLFSNNFDWEYSDERWAKSPRTFKLDRLSNTERSTVYRMILGQNPLGLSRVLAATVVVVGLAEYDLSDQLAPILTDCILSPEQAAAIVGCTSHNRLLFEVFENQARDLLNEVELFPADSVGEVTELYDIYGEARQLESVLQHAELTCPELVTIQDTVCSVEELKNRYKFEQSDVGLIIPRSGQIVVAKSIEEAIRMAEHDRSRVMALSPREFEQFLKEIFTRLGFEVELTKATRDGGADLLCMRSAHGIPFRLAVEAKRYKEDRPITVSAVRSFVGANEKFKANRLLFVTTSRFTTSAQEYADKYTSHLLTLRDYGQIQEWCREYQRITPRLL
jgi:HJR/Mrr/RecB family endonuclease